MRVLITTPYDLAVPGGVNRHAFDLLDALTRRGIEARLVGPASRAVRTDDPRVVSMGRVRTLTFNGAKSRLALDWRIVPALRRLMREFRPDVVHVQEPVAPLPGAAALWLAPRGAVRVGTFHTYSETSRGYLWAWPWCDAVWSRLDARIAVSEPACEFATRFHGGEFTVIPHGVRQPATAALRAVRPPARPARVLFVGRMDEPRKGFGVLVAALRLAETMAPGALTLEAVGLGADAWRERTADLPIEYCGELSDADLGRVYARCDLCCVPSVGGESFGLVALEALAHGVPVVASRIRGYAEWLGGAEVGEVVAPGDPAALAAALVRLTGDPALHARCAARARELAATFDWERCTDRLLEIYRGGRSLSPPRRIAPR